MGRGMDWRRGSESNTPRPGLGADDGFEDRGGHQPPITLHKRASGGSGDSRGASPDSALRLSAFVHPAGILRILHPSEGLTTDFTDDTDKQAHVARRSGTADLQTEDTRRG